MRTIGKQEQRQRQGIKMKTKAAVANKYDFKEDLDVSAEACKI
jgi:hypothetical protein